MTRHPRSTPTLARKRRRLEERAFGPEIEIDDAVLSVIDVEDAAQLVDRIEARLRARDEEIVEYRGVYRTTRMIRDCLVEDETRHIPHHVLPRSLLA